MKPFLAVITHFELTQGVLPCQLVLSSGTVLAAGVVLCGIGVSPATQFLEGSGVELDDRGFVQVDQVRMLQVEPVKIVLLQ